MSSEAELLALEVSHLESQGVDKVEVDEAAGRSGEVGRHEAREWTGRPLTQNKYSFS